MGFRGGKAQTWQNLPDLPHTDARAPPINTVRHRSQHGVSTRKMSMFDDKLTMDMPEIREIITALSIDMCSCFRCYTQFYSWK